MTGYITTTEGNIRIYPSTSGGQDGLLFPQPEQLEQQAQTIVGLLLQQMIEEQLSYQQHQESG